MHSSLKNLRNFNLSAKKKEREPRFHWVMGKCECLHYFGGGDVPKETSCPLRCRHLLSDFKWFQNSSLVVSYLQSKSLIHSEPWWISFIWRIKLLDASPTVWIHKGDQTARCTMFHADSSNYRALMQFLVKNRKCIWFNKCFFHHKQSPWGMLLEVGMVFFFGIT